MLCLGPGSVCDVCLEPFGSEGKAPCSIACGHVFCLDCLNHITRPSCPLCRCHLPAHSHVKLHIDIDNSQPSLEQQTLHGIGPAELEARRFQDCIAAVANEGSSEARLRQLIADCRQFLKAFPRDQFQELRISHRMLNYLCDVKSRLRSQDQAVEMLKHQEGEIKERVQSLEDLTTKLSAELANTKEELAKCQREKKEEKDTSLAIEMKLREHLQKTQDAYQQLAQLTMSKISDMSSKQIVLHPPQVIEDWDRHLMGSYSQKPSSLPQIKLQTDTPSIGDSSDQLLSPISLLLSPLSDFSTSVFPPESTQKTLASLPPEAEEGNPGPVNGAGASAGAGVVSGGGLQPPQIDARARVSFAGCGDKGCPYTCDCRPFALFTGLHATKPAQLPPSPVYGPTSPLPSQQPEHDGAGTPRTPLTTSPSGPGPASPSLLSMTAPKEQQEGYPRRASSHMQPKPTVAIDTRHHYRHQPQPQPSPRERDVPPEPSSHRDEQLSRLQDLLTDTPGHITSSLPNLNVSQSQRQPSPLANSFHGHENKAHEGLSPRPGAQLGVSTQSSTSTSMPQRPMLVHSSTAPIEIKRSPAKTTTATPSDFQIPSVSSSLQREPTRYPPMSMGIAHSPSSSLSGSMVLPGGRPPPSVHPPMATSYTHASAAAEAMERQQRQEKEKQRSEHAQQQRRAMPTANSNSLSSSSSSSSSAASAAVSRDKDMHRSSPSRAYETSSSSASSSSSSSLERRPSASSRTVNNFNQPSPSPLSHSTPTHQVTNVTVSGRTNTYASSPTTSSSQQRPAATGDRVYPLSSATTSSFTTPRDRDRDRDRDHHHHRTTPSDREAKYYAHSPVPPPSQQSPSPSGHAAGQYHYHQQHQHPSPISNSNSRGRMTGPGPGSGMTSMHIATRLTA